jgi:hypothetical protein
MDISFEGLNILISTFFVCADGFQGLSKAFHYPVRLVNVFKIAVLWSLKRVTGRIFKINKKFQRSKLNLFLSLNFSSTKKQKNVKTISACTGSTCFYYKLSKKYSSCNTIPLNLNKH